MEEATVKEQPAAAGGQDLAQVVGVHNQILQALLKERAEQEQAQQAQQEQGAQAEQEAALKQKIAQSMQAHPDQENFAGAVEHLGNLHAENERALGAPEEKIQDGLNTGLMGIAKWAVENGYDPARAIYAQAIKNGFTPKQAEKVAEGAEAAEATEAAQKEAAPKEAAEAAPKEPEVEDKGFVEAVNASKNPSGAGGAGGNAFAQAQAAKKRGDYDTYSRLMAVKS